MDKVVLLLERQALIKERDQLRAERDACVAVLEEIRRAAEMAGVKPIDSQYLRDICTRAQLPHAALRARLKDAVVAAARECAKPNNERDGHEYMDLVAASKALDAHDQGAGGGENGTS